MQQVLGVFIYCVVGMLFFMVFNTFSWSDPWLYIYMGLWPFILVFAIAILMLIIAVIAAVVLGALEFIDKLK